ncbi:MAG: hypothetical protein AMJ90_02430 [candidate division Zixibacteria bacterium SM23_73_2]|nr:MAG: hypothetical protein AMJ90_02430 [candidate division Zixibacteria bacterium SM23_73_2]
MNCKKIRKLILNYWDLTGEEKKALDQHLRDCPLCAKEFDFYNNSIEMIKNSFKFEAGENFWELYESVLSHKLSNISAKNRILNWLDDFFQFLKTPILGPLPAYVFSILIFLFVLLGLYPAFHSRTLSEGFENNLVINDEEIFSSIDDGGVTIYSVDKK